MDDPDVWGAWLRTAEELRDSHPDGVTFFAAIEVDARGIAPFTALTARLDDLGGEWWTYSLDDGRTAVSTGNRLRHITTGQNLATDYAQTVGASHMLFMAADCEPPADTLPKLLEVKHPLVGGHVSTYCLTGPAVDGFPFPVEEHMATAAFVLIARDVFRRLRWRWDADTGMSDDPCLHHDALTLLGIPTYVRHDVVGRHYPDCIPGIEHRGYDLHVERAG